MILGGGLVTLGLSLGVLPLILGALLITPAFEPVMYIGWGIALKNSRMMLEGIKSTAVGYLAAWATSIIVFIVLAPTQPVSLERFLGYQLINYWTSYSILSIIIPVLASIAGAIIVSTHRSVLTSGVTIILALMPVSGILGISIASGIWDLALKAFGKWLIDVSAIILVSVLIVKLKNRYWIHKRLPWY